MNSFSKNTIFEIYNTTTYYIISNIYDSAFCEKRQQLWLFALTTIIYAISATFCISYA